MNGIVILQSRRLQRCCRLAIVGIVGAAVAALPLVAGPIGLGGIDVAYVPSSASKAYAHSLIRAVEPGDPTARRWIGAGEAALRGAGETSLPHSAVLDVERSKPVAAAYRMPARTGRRLVLDVSAPGAREGDVFVEIFDRDDSGFGLVRSVPARPDSAGEFRYTWQGLADRDLVLRVQPALDYQGAIRISVDESPLLAFPVSGHSPRSIQSGFGAERDGGRRSHRGVDIFADRGTEVVASLDAWVARVDTTPRGGNVVWLQPLYGNLRLYYAHLDTQLVEEGQFVMAGDVLGTVGNTGNAITTPPHLHYGVYLRRRGVRGGARDPVDFLR